MGVNASKLGLARVSTSIAQNIFVFMMFNLLFGLHVKDTQCGCKAFKREVLESVLPAVESNGFEFDAELLFRCKKAGYKIKEVPVNWSYKPDSKLNLFKDTISMGKGVLKLWLKTYVAMQKN